MPMRSSAFPISSPQQTTVHAETFGSGLYDRILGGLVDFPGRTWQCVMVTSGSLVRLTSEQEDRVTAPAILWEPKSPDVRIRAKAGSDGVIMTLGEMTLANAIGHKPEAAALRLMSARRFGLDLSAKPDIRDSLTACFAAIFQELDASRTGMETVIEAQIRIMLVSLWRAGIDDMTQDAAYTQANLTLERFRHLLEAHLRERWPVQRFAAELGISADRLHDICTRTLATPPQRLIQRRLTYEAEALLHRSHLTLDQLADYLGFRSTPQFSAFFKAQTGFPPGAFRKAIRQKDKAAELVQVQTYADWP